MVEYGVGSSTIYDIKSQAKKLRDYMKTTDTPKAAENCHILQYHRGEMMDKVVQLEKIRSHNYRPNAKRERA